MRLITTDRRFVATLLAAAAVTNYQVPSLAVDDPNLRLRDTSSNLLSNDYYYIFGKVPPRKIGGSNINQPQWNTFVACVENSCTYVPIAQRYAAYSKYEPGITRGLRAFRRLLPAIERQDWDELRVGTLNGKQDSAPAVDALLKAGLLASQLLVSPNNLREKKEASLATFYVNEVNYALKMIREATAKRDVALARAGWDFGRDSWNSYLSVVNPSIVPKVGEPFELVTPL